jgi:hypothetical protein
MSLSRRCLAPLALLAILALTAPSAARASDFNQYKDLRNPYLRVTDIKERERFEERYVEVAGKVTLQKLPYKEVMVTAVLTQKPPSSLDTMFDTSDPYFRVCLQPFESTGQAMEEDCQNFRFQSLVKGNVGTTAFRLVPEAARYDIRVTQKIPDKGSAIKLWNPNAK